MHDDTLVALGVVVRPHGVRGELRVHRFNADSDLLLDLDEVVLRRPDGTGARVVSVRSARTSDKAVLLFLEDVNDRDAADALRGLEICVRRDQLPPTDEDEFYLVDLLGLDVYEGERRIGKVDRLFEYPSCDCLRVVGDDGVRELPVLPQFFAGVDLEARRIEARNVDDLPVEPPTKSGA